MVLMLVPLQKFAFRCFCNKQLKGGKYTHRIINVMSLLHHYTDLTAVTLSEKIVLVIISLNFCGNGCGSMC
jgi:hypothetical protein